jgi:hypothetical protein
MNKKSLNRTAFSATLHCLTGCAIGEVLGMVIGTAMGFGNFQTVLLSIVLAFLFGYSLSLLPVVRAGVALKTALLLVLAADTLSITTMEIVDNAVIVAIPGAMNASLTSLLFWLTLLLSLIVAFIAAFPVNRSLLSRGKGHALIHEHHHAHHDH